MDETRIALQRLCCRMFRNNNGMAKYLDKRGGLTVVKYGLGNGTGDLIGWRTMVITPEMVGHRIAQFVSAEGKRGDDVESEDQETFRKAVNAAGGVAIVFESPEDAVRQFEKREGPF